MLGKTRESSRCTLVEPSTGRLSFANLIEAHILEAARQHNVSSSAFCTAIDAVRQRKHGTRHPLLTRELHKREKRHFLESLASNTKDSRNRRSTRVSNIADALDRYLGRIERDANDDPYELFPMRRNPNRYVAVNIGLAAGHPVIAGTGLRVQPSEQPHTRGREHCQVANHHKLNEVTVAGALRFLAA